MAQKNVTVGSFKDECKVINLAAEYDGYTGAEKYALVTALSLDELEARYSKEIQRYKPFLILTPEMGEAIREYHRNNEKFAKREAREESVFITCSEAEEAQIQALSVEDAQTILQAESDDVEESQRIYQLSSKALKTLTPLQREYLIRHFINGESIRAIAEQTGTRKNNVLKTYRRGLKKYIRAINDMEGES